MLKARPCPYCGKTAVKIKRYINQLKDGIRLSKIYPVEIYTCCMMARMPQEMIQEHQQLKAAKIMV
jgi:hypothetical protein